MMHLLILGIIGSVLLPKALTLECHQCIPGAAGTCTDTSAQCPAGNQCRAYRVTKYAGNSKVSDINIKTCAVADECGAGTVNYGVSRITFTSKCCSTKLCNNQPAPEPPKTRPNGKKCFSCTTHKCSTTQPCEGDEDHCISATVTVAGKKTTMKGCASKSICAGRISGKQTAVIGTEMRCCQGDFCNSASSIAVNLLPLLLPLLSSALF